MIRTSGDAARCSSVQSVVVVIFQPCASNLAVLWTDDVDPSAPLTHAVHAEHAAVNVHESVRRCRSIEIRSVPCRDVFVSAVDTAKNHCSPDAEDDEDGEPEDDAEPRPAPALPDCVPSSMR